jgi:Skp family chaperone for outer membrane proteins
MKGNRIIPRDKRGKQMKRISERKKGFRGVVFAAFVCLFIAGSFAITVSAGETKIVSMDTHRVFGEHPAFREAMGKFQKQVQEMQKKVDEADEESKATAQQMMQMEMQQLGMQLQEEAFSKMKADVQKIAKEKGYDYVVDSNMLIVGGEDITEEILASFPKPEMEKKESPPAVEPGK